MVYSIVLSSIFKQYPPCYRHIEGNITIGDAEANTILRLLRSGALYAGSDGSVKDGCGAHAYGFTSSKDEGTVWGGAAITPGLAVGMSSLRAEHGRAIGVLLVLYAIQIYMREEEMSAYWVDVWSNNKEVLSKEDKASMGKDLTAHMVLDYNLWSVMNILQHRLSMGIRWKKVDYHIETRV